MGIDRNLTANVETFSSSLGKMEGERQESSGAEINRGGVARGCLKVPTHYESLQKARVAPPSWKKKILVFIQSLCKRDQNKKSSVSISTKSTVGFSAVTFRQYDTVMGTSPGGFSNIPTEILGWACKNEHTIDVDVYEASRGPSKIFLSEAQRGNPRGMAKNKQTKLWKSKITNC
mmetsp:Transcript_19468/g.39435  ORF Transcript_19468/g.39435 Transcript_19468/m.39435 type:complete len:175 (-) Transcript_19468:171-695(-)